MNKYTRIVAAAIANNPEMFPVGSVMDWDIQHDEDCNIPKCECDVFVEIDYGGSTYRFDEQGEGQKIK